MGLEVSLLSPVLASQALESSMMKHFISLGGGNPED
jgi:hypothetical protein